MVHTNIPAGILTDNKNFFVGQKLNSWCKSYSRLLTSIEILQYGICKRNLVCPYPPTAEKESHVLASAHAWASPKMDDSIICSSRSDIDIFKSTGCKRKLSCEGHRLKHACIIHEWRYSSHGGPNVRACLYCTGMECKPEWECRGWSPSECRKRNHTFILTKSRYPAMNRTAKQAPMRGQKAIAYLFHNWKCYKMDNDWYESITCAISISD